MKYKALILDVDGTILPPSHPTAESMSSRLVHSIQSVQSRGVMVSLATARSLDWVQSILDRLSLTGLQILDNGARVWSPTSASYVIESYIPPATAQQVLSLLRQYPYDIHFVDENKRQTFDIDHPPLLTKTVKMMILHVTSAQADEVYHRLRSISHIQITKSISGVSPPVESIHVTSRDATKEYALRRMMERADISLEEVVGVGDSYNDIGFLQICGLPIAMGNAIPEVKQIAQHVTGTYEEDGVAEVIDQYFLS